MQPRRMRFPRPVRPAPLPATALALGFSAKEWQALRALRTRYLRDPDRFAAEEFAHLQFARWLRETGRLES